MSKKNNNNKKKNFFSENPIMTFVIFSATMILIFSSIGGDLNMADKDKFNSLSSKKQDVAYYDLKKLISSGVIDKVFIGNTTIKAYSSSGNMKQIFIAQRVSADTGLIPLLESKKVPYTGYDETNILSEILFGWVVPILIFFAIWMFLSSKIQKNLGGGILGAGKSNSIVGEEKPDITFNDVAGNKEAKNEVEEITDFLKDSEKYIKLGAKIPKGVLLVGPPGTGKTLLAKAVAGEASVPFFSVSGSGFIEMFVGVGAARVRDLFEQAKKVAPSIIFIDEIDAIGKSRANNANMGGNDEREQTLNQLLAEMDGFASSAKPVIVLAATNRPEVLDPALLRPGRFDRQVLVDKPDYRGRIEILEVHIKGYKLAKDVDLSNISRLTAGLSGADLANIINEAGLLAGRANELEIRQKFFMEAIERQIAGLEKKSRRISPKEKKIVAYHESGHAVIAETTKGAKKVSKVSIVPRGLAALGYTLNTPEENKYLAQKYELMAEVDVLLGGRAAEEVFLGEISTGAGNDLERATDILKSMASIYGMTDVAGLMVLTKQSGGFLGGGGNSKDYSDATSEKLDEFIKNTLNERYDAVKVYLDTHREIVEDMVSELMDKEAIDGKTVVRIIAKHERAKETNEEESA